MSKVIRKLANLDRALEIVNETNTVEGGRDEDRTVIRRTGTKAVEQEREDQITLGNVNSLLIDMNRLPNIKDTVSRRVETQNQEEPVFRSDSAYEDELRRIRKNSEFRMMFIVS